MSLAKPHEITELHSPIHVMLRCSCGWSAQVSRRQNARVRASKVRAAVNRHRKEIADAGRPVNRLCARAAVSVRTSTPEENRPSAALF